MNPILTTSVECNGPLDVNVSVSGQIILDTSKLKALIPGAPAKIGGGFKIGGSGKTNLKGEASANANLKERLLQGGVLGLLGASGKGSLHAGGFTLYDDKIVGADGKIYGSAGILGKTVLAGDLGVGKDGKKILDGTKRLTGAGECNGGATVCVVTDEDALSYAQTCGNGSQCPAKIQTTDHH